MGINGAFADQDNLGRISSARSVARTNESTALCVVNRSDMARDWLENCGIMSAFSTNHEM